MRVIELGKEMRDELKICFGDGESIFKEEKTESLLYLVNVNISELEIVSRKNAKESRITDFSSMIDS